MAAMLKVMPVVTSLETESHYVKGAELLKQGHYDDPDGNRVDPEKMYRQSMPVIVARNHENRIKRALKRYGREGVTEYIKNVRKIVEAN